jgi:hypothetical protein
LAHFLTQKLWWISSTYIKARNTGKSFATWRIYSIFFGTKAPKQKLSILKEHWFDIAARLNGKRPSPVPATIVLDSDLDKLNSNEFGRL